MQINCLAEMRFSSQIIALLVLLPFLSNGQQNLIRNGSFEQIDTIVFGGAAFDEVVPNWFTPMSLLLGYGSSEIYHADASQPFFQTPQNIFGNQAAVNGGKGYAGITISQRYLQKDWREYIETELTTLLISGQEYSCKLQFSIAEHANLVPIASSYRPETIGMFLSDTIIARTLTNCCPGAQPPVLEPLFGPPQVSVSLPPFPDTINWMVLEGTFTAKGGEKYLTIGNFGPRDNASDRLVYLYIDEVSVTLKPKPPIPTTLDLQIPNVFTPNGDGYNDFFEIRSQQDASWQVQVFNRWGQCVFTGNQYLPWDGRRNGTELPEGVYYYTLVATTEWLNTPEVHNGTVTLLR